MAKRGRPRKSKFPTISVVRAGGKVIEIVLDGGRTVEDAIEAAGLRVKPSETVYVNDKEIDEDELAEIELKDGDKVVLAREIEGGF